MIQWRLTNGTADARFQDEAKAKSQNRLVCFSQFADTLRLRFQKVGTFGPKLQQYDYQATSKTTFMNNRLKTGSWDSSYGPKAILCALGEFERFVMR